MKICNFIFLSFVLLTIGCSKKEDTNFVLESDLIGDWEAIGYIDSDGNLSPPDAFAFGLYCDAILLKEDRSFVVYYQNSEFDDSKNSGTWSINESDLVLVYGTSTEIQTEITEFESDFLTLRYSWIEGNVETIKLQRK